VPCTHEEIENQPILKVCAHNGLINFEQIRYKEFLATQLPNQSVKKLTNKFVSFTLFSSGKCNISVKSQ
jgi:hypothetical protein